MSIYVHMYIYQFMYIKPKKKKNQEMYVSRLTQVIN